MAVIVVVLGSLTTAAGAQQSRARSFEVRTVDTRVVEIWILDLCDQHPEDECRVSGVSPGNPSQLTVVANAAVHAGITRLLAERDSAIPKSQSFQLVLVEGRREGGTDPALSDAARVALEDVKQFLPFESFRLIDTGLISTTRSGETVMAGEDVRYKVRLTFHRAEGVDGPTILVQNLFVQYWPTLSRPGSSSDEQTDSDGARARSGGVLIDTSVSLEVGETAVVGTSKLDGGEALIILITALPGG